MDQQDRLDALAPRRSERAYTYKRLLILGSGETVENNLRWVAQADVVLHCKYPPECLKNGPHPEMVGEIDWGTYEKVRASSRHRMMVGVS